MIPPSYRQSNIRSSVLLNSTVLNLVRYIRHIGFYFAMGRLYHEYTYHAIDLHTLYHGTAVCIAWYCTVPMTGRESMHSARGARARVSVNFRKFSPCMAPARRAHVGLTVYPPSRTLELLAFDGYCCRFDTSAFFWRI